MDRCRKKFGMALLGDEMGVGTVATPTLRHDKTNVRLSRSYPSFGFEFIKPSLSRTAVSPSKQESSVSSLCKPSILLSNSVDRGHYKTIGSVNVKNSFTRRISKSNPGVNRLGIMTIHPGPFESHATHS
jgi:hypothetical protein